MTKILAFDTATAACSAAIFIDGEITQQFELAPRRHGELLLPMIDQLLSNASITIKECDAIAFGNGPGSFMGLRIAAGVAQGLAFGSGIPVIPVSTLNALAQTAYWQLQCDSILVGWDARMNQIYWGVYQFDGKYMRAICPDQLSTPAEIQVNDVNCAAGNAWLQYQDSLSEMIKSLKHSEQDVYPTAKAVAFLAADALSRGGALAPDQLELSYLRNHVADKPSV